MKMSRARITSIAMTSGAILAASLFAAAPAEAALTSVTPASCAGEGGTFSRAKGINTCVVTPFEIRYENPNTIHSATVMGPFENDPNHTADGYYAEWRFTQGFRDTITYTQKGKKAVQSSTESVLIRQSMSYSYCGAITVFPDGTTGIAGTFGVLCDSLGMYPANIFLP